MMTHKDETRRRILIAEDSTDNRQILVYRLRKLGDFEIQEAANGRQAVDLVLENPPDLILMDLKMPLVDGWEATRQIRARERGRRVPIIAVTAQAMPGDEERALAAGCDDYIAKPITDPRQITAKIARFLGT